MKTAALALSALMLSASIPGAALAQTTVTLNETAPVLSLSITEKVDAVPDIAIVGTGVETRAATAKQAMADNAAQMTSLIAALRKAGIAKTDTQTSGINLSPQFDYSANPDGTPRPPRFLGYQASNQLTVKLRDVRKIGELLDALVEAGATNISGPTFSIADPEPLLVKARTAALKTAKARADFYAQQAGFRGVRLVSLSEQGGGISPRPMMDMAFKAERASTPVEPGEVSTSVTLTVQYALER